MDTEAQRPAGHGVPKSQTRLSQALFDAASQAEIDLSVENDQNLFVKGFVLGAQMMLEILTADPMEDVVR